MARAGMPSSGSLAKTAPGARHGLGAGWGEANLPDHRTVGLGGVGVAHRGLHGGSGARLQGLVVPALLPPAGVGEGQLVSVGDLLARREAQLVGHPGQLSRRGRAKCGARERLNARAAAQSADAGAAVVSRRRRLAVAVPAAAGHRQGQDRQRRRSHRSATAMSRTARAVPRTVPVTFERPARRR